MVCFYFNFISLALLSVFVHRVYSYYYTFLSNKSQKESIFGRLFVARMQHHCFQFDIKSLRVFNFIMKSKLSNLLFYTNIYNFNWYDQNITSIRQSCFFAHLNLFNAFMAGLSTSFYFLTVFLSILRQKYSNLNVQNFRYAVRFDPDQQVKLNYANRFD